MKTRGRAARLLALGILAAALGCQTTPKEPEPRYRPTADVLEAVAVLRRHVPDDTYRFPPARDFTGRNVYRASLLRLENLETSHADALRAGHLDDVIAFAKGRALERIRAFDLAARSYRRAAKVEGPLKLEALRSAALCEALAEAVTLGVGGSIHGEDALPVSTGRDAVLSRFEKRRALLQTMLKDVKGSHYEAVVREEIERSDEERARFLVASRRLRDDGNVRALAALQQLVVEHRDSKNANAHLLELADLYADLAQDYVTTNPPESLTFDPPRFQSLVDSATRLYESVSNQDGAPEKLEAARRLEAFLAFTLRVDRDRFTP